MIQPVAAVACDDVALRFVFIIAQKIYFYRSSKDARQLNCCRYFLGFCLFWKFYRLFSMMIMF